MGRASYYGEWADGNYSGDPTFVGPGPGEGRISPIYTQDCAGTSVSGGTSYNDFCYDGEWVFDIEGAYTFNETWSIIAGVNNVADNFGPLYKGNAAGSVGLGNKYEFTTPFGYDGGFWYFRVRADFE